MKIEILKSLAITALVLSSLISKPAHSLTHTFNLNWKNEASKTAPYRIEVAFVDLQALPTCDHDCRERLATEKKSSSSALRVWDINQTKKLNVALRGRQTIPGKETGTEIWVVRHVISAKATYIENDWRDVVSFRAISDSGEVLDLGTNETLDRKVNYYFFKNAP